VFLIDKIIDEQKQCLKEYVDKWIKISLCTEPADRSRAEKGILEAYQIANLKTPDKIVWCESPLSLILTECILSNKNNISPDIFLSSVTGSLPDSVATSVEKSVIKSSEIFAGKCVKDTIWDSVIDEVAKSSLNYLVDYIVDFVFGIAVCDVAESAKVAARDSVIDSVWNYLKQPLKNSISVSVNEREVDFIVSCVTDTVANSVEDVISASIWESLRSSTRKQVLKFLETTLRNNTGDVGLNTSDVIEWSSARDLVWDYVHDVSVKLLGDTDKDSVLNYINDAVIDSSVDSVRDFSWIEYKGVEYQKGSSHWLAFGEYFKEVCKMDEQTKNLLGLWKISQNAGYWIPHENICLVSERPQKIKTDNIGRLQDYNDYAISYSEGWGICAIHGVRVPEKYILTPIEKINPLEVLNERNAEVRTAVIKKCGFAHFLKHLPNKVISKDDSNALVEFNLGQGLSVRGLHLSWHDKTGGKETVIPVPSERKYFGEDCPDNIDDCEQVRRWTMWSKLNDVFEHET